jgi:proline dehydrogenase
MRLLHDDIIRYAEQRRWEPGAYEFEMLYGARPDVATELARRGQRVRLYLPFGRDWWPYAARRIGENPRNAYLLAKAALSRRGDCPRPCHNA